MRTSILIAATLLLAFSTSALMAEDDEKTATASTNPRVKLETTLGDIIIELDAEKAPISTQNFLTYTKDGFYNGTVFHRVIPNFMIQGGGFDENMDQKTSGLHSPIKNEWKNGLKNVRGTIAMARTAAADSATAQFFINVVDNDRLDQPISDGAAYAVFGKVVEGMAIVDNIRNTEVIGHPKYRDPSGAVTPKVPVVIKSATILNGEKKADKEGD